MARGRCQWFYHLRGAEVLAFAGTTAVDGARFLPSQERRVGSALRFLRGQERRSSRELKDDGPDFCTGRSCLCPLKGLELVDNRG